MAQSHGEMVFKDRVAWGALPSQVLTRHLFAPYLPYSVDEASQLRGFLQPTKYRAREDPGAHMWRISYVHYAVNRAGPRGPQTLPSLTLVFRLNFTCLLDPGKMSCNSPATPLG